MINSKSSQVLVLLIPLLFGWIAVDAQRYMDRAGRATFFSSAPLEDIEASSGQVVGVLDVQSGEIAASMLMRSFRFRKSLMQEHFNENYVESHKYPKATFKGKVTNIAEIDVTKDGRYTFKIDGDNGGQPPPPNGVIPEPMTAGLSMMSLLALAGCVTRRRR